MTTVLFDGELDVHYGFASLVVPDDEAPDLDEARAGQSNGLLGARVNGALSLMFALHTGPEPLRIEWSETEPLADERWEDVVEASVDLASTQLLLAAFDDYVEIEVPATGPHCVRFSGSGMDAAKDLDTREAGEDAPDRYLLQLWPARLGPDTIIRQTSEFAAYWHREARSEPDTPSGENESNPVSSAGVRDGNELQRPISTAHQTEPFGEWMYSEEGEQQRGELATEAALRIGADLGRLSSARALSGTVADITLVVILPRDVSALWPLFADLEITSMSAPGERAVGNEFAMESLNDADAFAGSGAIVCRWTELTEPTSVEMTWAWVDGFLPGSPRFAGSSKLRFELSDLDSADETPTTKVTLTHSAIPAEWSDDLTAVWLSKFDQWAYQSKPRKRRR